MSQLLARMLTELVEKETGYSAARERSLVRLREGVTAGVWVENPFQAPAADRA